MLGGSAIKTFEQQGYDHSFVETASYLLEGDINFANLETPITSGGEEYPNKQFTFRMSPKAVPSLVKVGFNLLSLANNHMMDFGPEGLADTLSILHKHGVHFAGAGRNLHEARTPGIVEVKGQKVALLAYSVTLPVGFYAGPMRPGTAFAYQEHLDADIPRIRKLCDFLIVSFHWGKELATFPEDYQVNLAHKVIDLGADLVLGHHPHVIQGIEVYKGRPVLYSLGNFAFSSYSHKVRNGMMARLTVLGNTIKEIEIIPLNVYNPDVDVQPKILTGQGAETVILKLAEASLPFGTLIGFEEDRGWVDLQKKGREDKKSALHSHSN